MDCCIYGGFGDSSYTMISVVLRYSEWRLQRISIVLSRIRSYTVVMLSDPAILDRVINSKRGDFSPDVARQVLKFAFPRKDRARYERLSYKAQDGTLTKKERTE